MAPTLARVYLQAEDYAYRMMAREERLSGQPITLTPTERIHEARLRMNALLIDASLGTRPHSEVIFAAVAHLLALELDGQRAEKAMEKRTA